MKIYSMTATFGKLEHETLTLKPGLNILEAPNEWGKSTWCAFLVAMLYGIETRVHTTKTVLADKERYAPWSGSPMAGRMDLSWNGRDITIERSSKGRSVFGVFRAYETETGLEIPELTAANCGQMLLGVEKSVFTRAGFLRLTDLPVTQDEALRRRLNALVTTGDESGTADALSQKLRDLKNRCRANRSTGLLPQAEAQKRELEDKLRELQDLQGQSTRIQARLEQLEDHHQALLNHQAALAYAANRTYAERLTAAEAAQALAADRVEALQAHCEALPESQEIERSLARLQELRELRESLHMEAQMLPGMPQMPPVSPPFRDAQPDRAVAQAQADTQAYQQNSRPKVFPWYAIVCLVLGLAALFIPHWIRYIVCGLLLLAGCGVTIAWFALRRRRANAANALLERYAPLPPDRWAAEAELYALACSQYQAQLQKYQEDRQELEQRAAALKRQIDSATGGRSLAECEQHFVAARTGRNALAEATREHQRAAEYAQMLRASHKEAPPPQALDFMTYTEAETARLLSDCTYELRQLPEKLGRIQGRMDTLGQEANLRKQLEAVTERIGQLEDTYTALEIAQRTLAAAASQLQRKFAPRITKRAQELFEKLTDGRYTRLTLGEDLTVHAGAREEDTLHSALWRSDGTMDQLYLALRMAVAEELTPEAPLVLDDALVRFDDKRLAEAVDLLLEESESKQVILFTCQSREAQLAQI